MPINLMKMLALFLKMHPEREDGFGMGLWEQGRSSLCRNTSWVPPSIIRCVLFSEYTDSQPGHCANIPYERMVQ
jgi:hypothetical protein